MYELGFYLKILTKLQGMCFVHWNPESLGI